MGILRKSWLTALCLSTTVMFFGQVVLCSADEAGLITCVQTTSQDDDSAPAKSGETPTTHCCHCTSHTPLLSHGSVSIFGGEMMAVTYLDRSEFVPEGSAREIDYPPQLS